MERVVQIEYVQPEWLKDFVSGYLREPVNGRVPVVLEVVYGCETGAVLHYTSPEEIGQELSDVRRRLDYIKNLDKSRAEALV